RFLEEVDRIIAEYAIGGPHIELEITETDIMTENKVLDKLLERGFRISIDDFGTGYSSLAYLKYLPADTIKIDRGLSGILRRTAVTGRSLKRSLRWAMPWAKVSWQKEWRQKKHWNY